MKKLLFIVLLTLIGINLSTSVYACENHGGSYRGFFAGYNNWTEHDIPDENTVDDRRNTINTDIQKNKALNLSEDTSSNITDPVSTNESPNTRK